MARTPRGTTPSSDPRPPASVRFNVKLVPGACATDLLRSMEGVLKIEPLFPDDQVDELSSIYIIEVRPEVAGHLAHVLRQDPSVEFVEDPPRRRGG